MPRKTKEERQTARAGKKEDRQTKRAGNIERRRGLEAGEGAKVLENRKTRRKELFYTPEAGEGKFTDRYEGKKSATPETGGGINTTQESEDRTDIASTAGKKFVNAYGGGLPRF